tara:strand:+ start:457 stop:768 length:312 start_codon:yes stop_codon:yes gene_type:complete
MPFIKGDTRINRGGRKSGVANRTTEAAKLTITRAVNGILDTMHADLLEIKKKDPIKAMELSLKLLEYTIPKLKSIDINGSMDINAKIQQISININRPDDRIES